MKTQHVPTRKCVACRNKFPKEQLLRIVRTLDGTMRMDENRQLPGRGAYVCPTSSCIQKAIKSKAFERILHQSLGIDMIEKMVSRSEPCASV